MILVRWFFAFYTLVGADTLFVFVIVFCILTFVCLTWISRDHYLGGCRGILLEVLLTQVEIPFHFQAGKVHVQNKNITFVSLQCSEKWPFCISTPPQLFSLRLQRCCQGLTFPKISLSFLLALHPYVIKVIQKNSTTPFLTRFGRQDPLSQKSVVHRAKLRKMFLELHFCGLFKVLPFWDTYSRIIVSTYIFKSYGTTEAVSPLHSLRFPHRLSFTPIFYVRLLLRLGSLLSSSTPIQWHVRIIKYSFTS